MKIFEDIEKYSFYLLIGLAVHDIVPVWVFYLLLAYLSVGLGYTSLEFQKILVKFLSHGIITYWVYYTLKEAECLGTLLKGLAVLDIKSVDPAELQFYSDHTHVKVDGLEFTGLVIELWFL